MELQCKPLNVITDNVIIRLMWSNCPRLSKSQITNKQALCISRQLLIVIIRLMLSLSLCPKVITLSGFHCTKCLPALNSLTDFLPTKTCFQNWEKHLLHKCWRWLTFYPKPIRYHSFFSFFSMNRFHAEKWEPIIKTLLRYIVFFEKASFERKKEKEIFCFVLFIRPSA